MTKNKAIEKLAKELGFETLETRKSDRLDFKELAVWEIKKALDAAYEAGREAASAKAKKDCCQAAVDGLIKAKANGWGFYGIARNLSGGDVDSIYHAVWKAARGHFNARGSQELEAVSNFLVSKYGRHLADSVAEPISDGSSPEEVAEAVLKKLPGFESQYRSILTATIDNSWRD